MNLYLDNLFYYIIIWFIRLRMCRNWRTRFFSLINYFIILINYKIYLIFLYSLLKIHLIFLLSQSLFLEKFLIYAICCCNNDNSTKIRIKCKISSLELINPFTLHFTNETGFSTSKNHKFIIFSLFVLSSNYFSPNFFPFTNWSSTFPKLRIIFVTPINKDLVEKNFSKIF